jgi:hypothetical protein
MDAHPFRWQLPNIALYPLALLGADFFLALPFMGAVGLVTLVRWLRGAGSKAVVGRFGLAALLLVLGVHLVYWYQAERFLLLPSSLLNIAGAVALASGLEAVRRRMALSDRWARASSALQPAHLQRLAVVIPVAITLVGLGLLSHGMVVQSTGTETGNAFTHGVSELHEELDRYGIQ